MLKEYNLEDVAKLAAPRNEVKFTHFQLSSHARLDRIYVPGELTASISGYDVKPLFFSDHCLVAVTLGTGGKPSRRFNWKLWKMKVSLLKDEIFVSGVKRVLDELFGNNDISCMERWEFFKQKVKELVIERSSVLKSNARNEERVMQQYLLDLLKAECHNPGINATEIKEIKAKLDEYQRERCRGAVVRARADKFLLGEQPTSRALADEKKFAFWKEISAIEHDGILSHYKDVIELSFIE